MKEKTIKNKGFTVPVFFAADENYMPFLAVTLASLKAHASTKNKYKIHVLYTGTLGENAKAIKKMATPNLSVRFVNITKKAAQIQSVMRCRDYYTSAIYFRLFIPELFPCYDKAIYLDCDTVLCEDIAELFAIDIKDSYIGAVADQAVAAVPAFCEYTSKALGIEPQNYFNSGVITLNLKKLRSIRFYNAFYFILKSYEFTVAPDQDCLNLICKDKTYYYGGEWNAMPSGSERTLPPKLIHYNLSLKPWHYDGVLYEEHFWAYAKQTPFYHLIAAKKAAFTPQMALRDQADGERLLALAKAEADSPSNYLKTMQKSAVEKAKKTQNEVGRYGFIEGFGRAAVGAATD